MTKLQVSDQRLIMTQLLNKQWQTRNWLTFDIKTNDMWRCGIVFCNTDVNENQLCHAQIIIDADTYSPRRISGRIVSNTYRVFSWEYRVQHKWGILSIGPP